MKSILQPFIRFVVGSSKTQGCGLTIIGIGMLISTNLAEALEHLIVRSDCNHSGRCSRDGPPVFSELQRPSSRMKGAYVAERSSIAAHGFPRWLSRCPPAGGSHVLGNRLCIEHWIFYRARLVAIGSRKTRARSAAGKEV